MPTKQGSSFDKVFTEYSENTRKIMRKLGRDLVPPMDEAEFVSLNNELQRLLGKVSRFDSEGKELVRIQDKGSGALSDFKTLLGLLSKERMSKKSSLLMVSLFLFGFEGLYCNNLDSFCLQLVIEGHDLFDPIKREYISSLNEIGDVDIATKFKFLERHNLKMLVRRKDQRLRNRIAHYDFSVDNDGNFSIDGKVVSIGSRILNLLSFLVCVNFVTGNALKTILRKRKAKKPR